LLLRLVSVTAGDALLFQATAIIDPLNQGVNAEDDGEKQIVKAEKPVSQGDAVAPPVCVLCNLPGSRPVEGKLKIVPNVFYNKNARITRGKGTTPFDDVSHLVFALRSFSPAMSLKKRWLPYQLMPMWAIHRYCLRYAMSGHQAEENLLLKDVLSTVWLP